MQNSTSMRLQRRDTGTPATEQQHHCTCIVTITTCQNAHVVSLLALCCPQLGVVQRPEARPVWATTDKGRLHLHKPA